MTKARDIADFKFENIVDTGTEGTKIAAGTNAQRGSTAGQIRFNSDTGLAEYYTGSAFKVIDAPPTISSVDVTEVDSQAGGNQTIVVTGSGFNSGATVTFVGNAGTDFNASTTTVDSATQITAVAPKSSFLNAQEPYGVKVANTSGLSAILASQINVDSAPTWTTASGSLGTIYDSSRSGVSYTVTATDADGDTIVYSVQSGALPTGLSLNSSTGEITGTASAVGSDTTSSFTLRATAGSKTSDRAFSITVNAPTYVQLSGSGTWSVPTGVDSAIILIVGGGSSGTRSPNIGAGGGGAGGVVYTSSYTFTSTDKSSGIVYSVGAGGDGLGISPYAYDGGYNSGGDTTFAISGGTITAKGGGSGGGYGGASPFYSGFSSAYFPATAGGSGGGGAWDNLVAGTSNQPTFSGWTSYGNSGGTGQGGNSGAGAGGGGAGSAGANVSNSNGTNGGAGQYFAEFASYGDSGYFAGGGGGGGASGGSGGQGGGGNGGNSSTYSGGDATDGTGGGGGGSKENGYGNYTYKAGDGGNGTILIKY